MTLRARKLLVYAVAVALLLAVFVLYTPPQIMVVLSEQVWACFQ
jgi:hypothetical protein